MMDVVRDLKLKDKKNITLLCVCVAVLCVGFLLAYLFLDKPVFDWMSKSIEQKHTTKTPIHFWLKPLVQMGKVWPLGFVTK